METTTTVWETVQRIFTELQELQAVAREATELAGHVEFNAESGLSHIRNAALTYLEGNLERAELELSNAQHQRDYTKKLYEELVWMVTPAETEPGDV